MLILRRVETRNLETIGAQRMRKVVRFLALHLTSSGHNHPRPHPTNSNASNNTSDLYYSPLHSLHV